MKLKRSNDRKVTNSATPNGKQSNIANAFGLPAGAQFSCPGMTNTCGKVCYAGRIEKAYKAVMTNLMHNYNLLTSTDFDGQIHLLNEMIREFRADCVKKGAPKAFRIHWDGDFYSREYASAWAYVIQINPDIQFWVYTRSFTPVCNVIDILADIPNLALYLSVDVDNEEWAKVILAEYPSVMIASLSDTMDNAAIVITDIRGDNKPGAKCPELIKAIPLISVKGGACITCQLCPMGKADIRFASTKAGRV